MSDLSESSGDEYEEENITLETPVKEKKKRAPRKLNEEQKAKALENLRKGREKRHKEKAEEKDVKTKAVKELKEKRTTKKTKEPVLPDVEDIEEPPIIVKQEKPKKKKQRKIILQTESDSDSDEDCIVIKTKGRKKKQPVSAPIIPPPTPLVRSSQPKIVQETPFQKQQRLKMENIYKNAEMMMTQYS